jgi:hypothetical protein
MMAQRKKRATLGKRKSTARSQGGKTRKPTRGKAAKPPNRSQENVWLRPCPNALERRSVPGKEHGTTRPTSATDAPVAPHDTAERRQVSVMFSDLVGSTALSARMDPEDLREVISAYQRCVAETVGRFGGFVAKYMGDGVWCISGIRRPMNGHNIYHI